MPLCRSIMSCCLAIAGMRSYFLEILRLWAFVLEDVPLFHPGETSEYSGSHVEFRAFGFRIVEHTRFHEQICKGKRPGDLFLVGCVKAEELAPLL